MIISFYLTNPILLIKILKSKIKIKMKFYSTKEDKID